MGTSPFHGVVSAVRWNDRLFVACGLNGLKVFAMGDGEPKLMACLDAFPAFDLALKGDLLAIAAGERGIVLLDAATLQPIKLLTTPFPVHALRWRDGLLTGLSATSRPAIAHFADLAPPLRLSGWVDLGGSVCYKKSGCTRAERWAGASGQRVGRGWTRVQPSLLCPILSPA